MRRVIIVALGWLALCGAASAQVNGTYSTNPGTSGKIFEPPYGYIWNPRVVTVAGAVTINPTDFIVIVNKASGAATTVNLPSSPDTGRCLRIKDGKGDAGTNSITITPAAGNIDGASTFIIVVNYGSIDVCYNGTQWNVL